MIRQESLDSARGHRKLRPHPAAEVFVIDESLADREESSSTCKAERGEERGARAPARATAAAIAAATRARTRTAAQTARAMGGERGEGEERETRRPTHRARPAALFNSSRALAPAGPRAPFLLSTFLVL
eukprot:scaffold22952_cov30-Tisochrysis_lutea.AAC.3